MDSEIWTQVTSEAIDRLMPYGPVILMGLESVRRHMGRHIERKDLVIAKSVYALLKASFERDQAQKGQQLLDLFVKEPDAYRTELTELIAEKASRSPADFGRKLIALTNRWREYKRPLPSAE
jgi:hypothetical protein